MHNCTYKSKIIVKEILKVTWIGYRLCAFVAITKKTAQRAETLLGGLESSIIFLKVRKAC